MMNRRKMLNKAPTLIVTLIAAVGILAAGLATIPALILVGSGIADVYLGITPMYSIPGVALIVIVMITWMAFGAPLFDFNIVTGRWPASLNIFQSIKRRVWNIALVSHAPPTRLYRRSMEMNFLESSRRIAILRRGVFPENRTMRSVSDDEAKHSANGTAKKSNSFAATAR